MEVGPFRTVPASQTESGEVELKLVQGGWEEFATIIFGMCLIFRPSAIRYAGQAVGKFGRTV